MPYQCGILFLNQKHSVPIHIPVQMKGKTNPNMDLPEPNYNLVQQADLMAELIDPTADSFFFLENEPKLYEEQCSFLNRVAE